MKWPEWGAKPEATDLELELPLSAATGRSTAATYFDCTRPRNGLAQVTELAV